VAGRGVVGVDEDGEAGVPGLWHSGSVRRSGAPSWQ
jgi:hypothetical protein